VSTTFNPTVGPDRVTLEDRDHEYIEEIEKQGTLFVDPRRARSHYFDGRFLAARDLIREQNYVLSRQADLSRAGGSGVIRGLQVVAFGNRGLRIFPGHGTTFAGELVALDQGVTVDLDDVSELQQLDASFGLAPIPLPPAGTRNGLYVLALRPVEYVTREITKYPTTINGKRSSEPGDIVEGVALTLIPYRDDRQERDPWKQRSHVARALFFDRGARGIPAETLPLAMLSLERGFIRWLDPYLVRREIGAEHGGVVGFGLAPRALREAHMAQYDRQLRELVVERQSKGSPRFAAADYFEVLPPTGRMPAACIEGKDFTQHWFPAQMTVDLTIVTQDEVTMLVEESLLLPPIDVSGEADELDFTTMQILIPMSREALRRLRLETAPRTIRLLPPLYARRKPIDVLHSLTKTGFIGNSIVAVNPKAAIEAAWRAAIAAVSDQLLWFVRRRTLEVRAPELFPGPNRQLIELVERELIIDDGIVKGERVLEFDVEKQPYLLEYAKARPTEYTAYKLYSADVSRDLRILDPLAVQPKTTITATTTTTTTKTALLAALTLEPVATRTVNEVMIEDSLKNSATFIEAAKEGGTP
jgi:hypothetical protein